MKTLLPLIAILSACAGGAEMKPDGSVKVYGPLAARVDRLAVNAKTSKGEMKFLMVNGNSEAVPNNAINLLGTGLTLKAATKVNDNQTAVDLGAQKPTVLTPTVDPVTGKVLKPTVVFPPK